MMPFRLSQMRGFGIAAVFLFLLYFFLSPLPELAHLERASKGFQEHEVGLESIGNRLADESLGLNDLPKYLAAVVSTGGLLLILRSKRQQHYLQIVPAVFMFLAVAYGLWLAWNVHNHYLDAAQKLDIQYADLGTHAAQFSAHRFRELLLLFMAMVGVTPLAKTS